MGGKHSHHLRIPRDVLRKFGARLSREDRALRNVPSFDELDGVVLRVGDLTHGIGELAVYDTALRIGAKLDLPPLWVDLHRGSRDGAVMLGVDARRPWVAVSELPTAFATLEPREIEDGLCIFKGLLSGERSLPPEGCRCGGRGCARPARSTCGPPADARIRSRPASWCHSAPSLSIASWQLAAAPPLLK